MGTFLTNSKMSPQLAARIEGSVRGRAAKSARVTSLVRLTVVAAIIGVAGVVVVGRRQEKIEVDRERAALLDALHARGASLTEQDKQAVTRDEAWLTRLSAPYEGDWVAPELREPGALATVLAGDIVYVHGAIDGFTSSMRIGPTAAASVKDAFLLCLVERPSSRSENILLGKVRAAYSVGAALEQRTADVRRLHDAEAGSRLLLPPWEERVKAARDHRDMVVLRAELDSAPLDRAKQAMRAKTLVAVMDEPGPVSAPAELDGERAHQVRVAIVDRAGAKILLRLRQRVDPAVWSPASRSEYASGLDACALAFDVQQSVKP